MKLLDIKQLTEGIFDFLKKKKKDDLLPITDEQRKQIKKHFSSTNVDVKYAGENSRYVLPLSVNGIHGKGRINFYNDDGVLYCSVGVHGSEKDAIDQKVSPLYHIDVELKSDDDFKKLKAEL